MAQNAALNRKPRAALVTNIPTPYRVPVFNRIAQDGRIDLAVVFCAEREPNREWDRGDIEFEAVFLEECFVSKGNRYIHNNRDVLPRLRQIAPDVIITTGFNPTFLYAFGYALLTRKRHIAMTDGTYESERGLTGLHRLVRKFVFKHTRAFLGASRGSRELYRTYAVPDAKCFVSPLCIDNERYAAAPAVPKLYDFMFCGRFAQIKQPLMALAVAERAAMLLRRPVSLLFVGSGEMEAQIREQAQRAKNVNTTIFGFAKQAELPSLYKSARVFLFPTQWDPWGLVANEACAAGLPVIVTPHAGAAGEIVVDGVNGYVRELDANEWAMLACRLLNDPNLYERCSRNSITQISGYSYAASAEGVIRAVLAALDLDPNEAAVLADGGP